MHLYDDGKSIHQCEGAQIVSGNPGTYVVWTLCDKDVPANQSFKSAETPTCPRCRQEGE
jgi:hypothetical protein